MSSSYSSYSSQSPASSQEYQSYFVPGYGISRHIIFSHIQYYLGPYATVRPYQFRGREGFLVNAPGQPLTKASFSGFYTRYASTVKLLRRLQLRVCGSWVPLTIAESFVQSSQQCLAPKLGWLGASHRISLEPCYPGIRPQPVGLLSALTHTSNFLATL